MRDHQLVASLNLVPERALWAAITDVRDMRPTHGPGMVVVHHVRCGIIEFPEDEDLCNCKPILVRISLVTPQA